jgi:myo-inositol-1(or 4)-monophosphatase
MGDKSSYLHVMSKAVEKASRGVIRDFGELELLQPSQRGVKSFADRSCRRIAETVAEILSRSYPDIHMIEENTGSDVILMGEAMWVIIPMSGITNFMRGIPHFAISISLLEGTTASAGITLNPLRGEYYRCEVGGGAFVNNKNRLRVSDTKIIGNAVITTNLSPEDDVSLIKNSVTLRKTSSVALDMAYLAAGKYDACLIKGIPLFDVVTGMLLIREAGGFIECEKTEEGKCNIIAASSNELMHKLLSLYNTM